MAVSITIRDVPAPVRDELASRAARQGRSMQEYLKAELTRLAEKPSLDSWLDSVRERKALGNRRVPPRKILAARVADRR